jgi:hypothetical protein
LYKSFLQIYVLRFSDFQFSCSGPLPPKILPYKSRIACGVAGLASACFRNGLAAGAVRLQGLPEYVIGWGWWVLVVLRRLRRASLRLNIRRWFDPVPKPRFDTSDLQILHVLNIIFTHYTIRRNESRRSDPRCLYRRDGRNWRWKIHLHINLQPEEGKDRPYTAVM